MSSRILVVNDKLLALNALQGVLTSEGYAVESARTSNEGMDKLGGQHYDLVIANFDLSDKDGFAFIERLRNSSPATGLVLLGQAPSQEQIRRAVALKIKHYLPYNCPPSLLHKTIGRTLRKPEQEKGMGISSEAEWSAEVLQEVDSIIRRYEGKSGGLIPALQMTQEAIGYLPPSILKRLAKGMRISESEIHGVVSFYSFFTMRPRGRHNVRVCLGTACYVKAAEEIVRNLCEGLQVEIGGMTSDKKFSLETVRCLGACGLAPVVVVDKDTHGFVNPVKGLDILKEYE